MRDLCTGGGEPQWKDRFTSVGEQQMKDRLTGTGVQQIGDRFKTAMNNRRKPGLGTVANGS